MSSPPSRHERSVRRFFDELAPTYRQRYSTHHPFLAWFFRERLRQATAGLSVDGSSILDIGAGTGALYDFLQQQAATFDYYACDLSAAMLANSNIPPARRFTGAVTGIDFPLTRFDLIFGLGLTSYLEPAILRDTLGWIATHLAPQGHAILSFTNRRSLDFRLRRLIRPLARRLGRNQGVLGQDFTVYAYTPKEVATILPEDLSVKKVKWLPPLLPPLDRLAPRLAIRLSSALAEWPMAIQPLLAADFLVMVEYPGEG